MFETPKNVSLLTRRLDRTSRTVDDEGVECFLDEEGVRYYELTKSKRAQFVLSQLVASVVPVTPVLIDKTRVPWRFYSQTSDVHHDSVGLLPIQNFSQELFLSYIFQDCDHDVAENHNFKDGVFFDFDRVSFGFESDEDYQTHLEFVMDCVALEKFDVKDMKLVVTEVLRLVSLFRATIVGQDGLRFVRAVCGHAGYIFESPEEIQELLLWRCRETTEYLEGLLRKWEIGGV